MDCVTVRLAGEFGVSSQQLPSARLTLGSRKARRLLMVLAAQRDQLVPTDRIVDALWPDRPPQRPPENLATLVSRLRASLGASCIIGGRDGYRLGTPPAVSVDLDEASRFVAEASRRLSSAEPGLAWTAATKALEMLGAGGILVDEPDADWLLATRAEGQQLLRSARHLAATAALLIEDPQAARALAEAAIGTDRFDEAAHRLLMKAHMAAGESANALTAYERLRAELADELGVDPSPQTRDVHLAVLREQQPGQAVEGQDPAIPNPKRVELPGRAAELARLLAGWAAAACGRPELLLLVGEAGIGKTRLAAEAVAEARSTGGLILQARCYPTERSLLLQPFVDALSGQLSSMRTDRLRELAGVRAGALVKLLPEIAAELAADSTDRASAEVELRWTYEVITSVLRGLSTSQAVLLVLDDLHNAGVATVELLHYLIRHAKGARLLVLATVRAEEGGETLDALREVCENIDVGPLPADAVAQLARDAGQAELVSTILRKTRGHALFVVETLRGLVAGDLSVPESLQAAVLARLRRAGASTEELLRAGSVLGNSVDPVVIAGLLELSAQEAARRCEQAASSRLLVAAGRDYEFANDLVREVLYETTAAPTRLAYHRRAADLLTRQPESVAMHAAAAEDWPRAARAYLLAGEQAAGRYAAADAEALLTRALDAAQRTDEREVLGRIYLARGQARVTLTQYRGARGDLNAAAAAARHAGDRRLEMIALRELGYDSAFALGVPLSDTTRNLEAALDIAESLADRAMEADLLATSAILSANRLRFNDAIALGHRAVATGRAAGDERALASGLDGLKTAFAYLGDLTELAAVLAELEPLLRRRGDLYHLQWTIFESGFASIAAADWDTATRQISEAIAINERSGYLAGQAWFVAHLGWVARLRGRMEEAVGHGRRAVALGQQTAHRWWRSTASSLLAGTLLELGQRDEAVGLLTDARHLLEPDGPEGYRLRCLGPLAEATGSRAVLDQATALLGGLSAPPDSAWLLGLDSYLSVGRGWLDHGEPAQARAVLGPMLQAARRHQWLPSLACGYLVDGRAAAALGDQDNARRLLRRAGELATRHGMACVPHEAERVLSELTHART